MYGTTYRLITACKVQFFPKSKSRALIPCSFVLCTRPMALLWILSRVYDSINFRLLFSLKTCFRLLPIIARYPFLCTALLLLQDTYEMIYILRSFLSDKIKILHANIQAEYLLPHAKKRKLIVISTAAVV